MVVTEVPAIDVFAPGATKPKFRFGRFYSPRAIALNPEKTKAYVLQSGFAFVTTFDYPRGRAIANTRQYFAGRLTGVAVGPSTSR